MSRSSTTTTKSGLLPNPHPGAILIQHTQLSQGDTLNVRRQFPAPPTAPDQGGFPVGEASDHGRSITCRVI